MNKKITNVRLINKDNEEDVLKLVGVVGFGGWTQEGIYHKPTDDRFWILSETVTDDFHRGHHIMHDITAEIDETWDGTFWGWSEYRVEYDVLNEVFEGDTTGDAVHKPSHYQLEDGTEVKDHIRSLLGDEGFKAYAIGNAIKYIGRYADKENPIQDLQKSQEYLDMVIEVLEGED